MSNYIMSYKNWSRLNEQAKNTPFDLALSISHSIDATFKNEMVWKEFKGNVNDDEAAALKYFNSWWSSLVEPKLANMTATDKNTQTILRVKQEIQAALSGEEASDIVNWQIVNDRGEATQFSVDTDF